MTSLPDSIISVFLEKRQCILTDTEVNNALVNQGISCNVEDIRRHVQLLSPGLFQLINNANERVTIRVEPKIEICGEFLNNNCKPKGKQCDRLHICRHFEGNCPSQNCGFPHDFSTGYNRKIIAENHCQYVNPILLIKLLRLKKSSSRPPASRLSRTRGSQSSRRGRGYGHSHGRGRSFSNHATSRNSIVQKDDPNRQVDVSFPSSSLAKQMDMEMIEILLNLHDIKIEDKFNENENEYFRRVTIQLGRIDDVEKLLSSPVINHHGIDIKFKHTNQIIDRTRFLLKTSINNVQDKIISSRMELYISTLIKNNSISKISDLSTSTEQIILVHCNRDIDFDGVRQAYKSKQELSGKHLTLNQVYECDALEVHYNDTNKSITVEDLKIIFESAWNDIFAFNFPTNNCAEIEFINTQAFKRWISTVEQIQIKFQITINPILDSVDENNDTESISSTHAAPSTIDTCSIASNGFDDRSRQTTIKLRPDWVLIATHPKFKLEYKEFIHNELSGEIDIHDDEVTYSGSFPQHIHGMKNNVTLQEKTNNFMRNFAFRTFYKLESRNIEILRANAATVAFNRIIDNDYMIATKVLEMPGFVRKLFAKNNQHHQQEQPYLKTNTQSNN
ncbi:unnamed protein product, partial [Rotaria sp. Silwood1]